MSSARLLPGSPSAALPRVFHSGLLAASNPSETKTSTTLLASWTSSATSGSDTAAVSIDPARRVLTASRAASPSRVEPVTIAVALIATSSPATANSTPSDTSQSRRSVSSASRSGVCRTKRETGSTSASR